MISKLHLNQEVILSRIAYRVIGIDSYKLKNVLGNEKKWVSYTLTDKSGKKTWISFGGTSDKYFTQWFAITKNKFKTAKKSSLNLDLTGIATITFAGKQGISLPTAEITCFYAASDSYDFLSIERFLDYKKNKLIPSKPYFLTGRIIKDFVSG